MVRYQFPLLIIVAFLIIAGTSVAHSPQFVEDNESLNTALEVKDTVKSWAIYSHLHDGDPRYYTFEMSEGDRLLLNLIVPVKDGDEGFLPRMVLMAPGISNEGALPGLVETPDGYGYQVIESSLPEEATYEGFSPSAYYELGSSDYPAPVTGRYYVAVFSTPPIEGNFALVVGYAESFTLQEMVLIPFSLYSVYLWEGQGAWQVLAPMALTLVAGMALFLYFRRRRTDGLEVQHFLLLVGGLIILGTAASTATQAVISVWDSQLGMEVMITVFLFLIPGVFALFILRRAWDGSSPSGIDRAILVVLGLLSVVAWAGYIVGPALVVFGALLPERKAYMPRR
ncbi:MAG TPA: hypothetical protein VMW85_07620 [Methanomassiliicoccales archaeon]|nr:hypothetical protein [Methanomassiliicoccales archaeon]